ncbi:hypothetical protein LPUS_09136 [Lasallia pustulata]|uniref:Uncharacterized protein n=1 Tax=Lasallia pustulata TaxID=136370 RepID=A0A1W5D6Y3_9LECA|nr:hypothetical protein LPUS_09136 [Lasallia pustulata]
MLKASFGMQDLMYDDDFANVLSLGIQGWQSINWDPAESSPDFGYYCGNITSQKTQWPGIEAATSNASMLIQAGAALAL